MTVDELLKILKDAPPHYKVQFMYNDSDLLYGVVSFVPCNVNTVVYDEKTTTLELRE
jgi:hypothetical protein